MTKKGVLLLVMFCAIISMRDSYSSNDRVHVTRVMVTTHQGSLGIEKVDYPRLRALEPLTPTLYDQFCSRPSKRCVPCSEVQITTCRGKASRSLSSRKSGFLHFLFLYHHTWPDKCQSLPYDEDHLSKLVSGCTADSAWGHLLFGHLPLLASKHLSVCPMHFFTLSARRNLLLSQLLRTSKSLGGCIVLEYMYVVVSHKCFPSSHAWQLWTNISTEE
jgi:hypothetical protein